METNATLKILLQKYASGEISPEDRTALYRALTDNHNEQEFKSLLSDLIQQTKSDENYNEADWTGVIRSILGQKAAPPKIGVPQKIWFRAAAAASIIALLGLTAYFGFFNKKHSGLDSAKNKALVHDIAAGSNKATLTLGNGATMILDSEAIGTLAQQGSTKISKTDSGQLAYTIEKSNRSSDKSVTDKQARIEENVLTTPRGGQYQLVLPDGTKVWLNAASSITYPTAFSGTQRFVKITGEVYFEVVHNAKMPFVVKVLNNVITDLGTSFNVNAYADEGSITTTLINGSVKIYKGTFKNKYSDSGSAGNYF